jgi:hypothetical protein
MGADGFKRFLTIAAKFGSGTRQARRPVERAPGVAMAVAALAGEGEEGNRAPMLRFRFQGTAMREPVESHFGRDLFELRLVDF